MTNKNIGALDSFMSWGSSLKFDLNDSNRVWISSEAERKIAHAIADVTEVERELQRNRRGKGQTLLTDEIDLVDTMHWDEFLQAPHVVIVCAKHATVSPVDVLEFVTGNCKTSNPSALFWMKAWFQMVFEAGEKTSQDVADALSSMQEKIEKLAAEKACNKAKAMAEARHGKAGASRDKRAQIRTIWASGKYSTKELCAEEEHDALGMSFSTARRALQGAPSAKK